MEKRSRGPNRRAIRRTGEAAPSLNDILDKLRACLPEVRVRYSVRSLGVFGSHVTGGARKKSDVDILVEFDETPGLLKFVRLERHLSEALGLKADLVMASSLKPNIGRRIRAEVVSV